MVPDQPLSELPPDLEELDKLLLALPDTDDAMLLGDLDGYLAGILVSPHRIPERKWLCEVWGGAEAAFPDDPERSARLVERILARKAQIAEQLLRGNLAYTPIYDLDLDGYVLWEVWISGFSRAMGVSGKNWDSLLETGDEDLGTAFLGLLAYVTIEKGLTDQPDLAEQAPTMIPYLVETLYRCQHGLPRVFMGDGFFDDEPDYWEPPEPARVVKIGRNSPCPCGSGAKYKKCCGIGVS